MSEYRKAVLAMRALFVVYGVVIVGSIVGMALPR
jgi:hypothetical protein